MIIALIKYMYVRFRMKKRDLLLVPIWKRQKEEVRAPVPEIELPDMFSEKLRYLSLRDNYLYDVPSMVFKLKGLDKLDLRK